MTAFNLSIEMDNAAFADDGMGGREELARLLSEVADRVADTDSGRVFDVNGNTVGSWKIEG